MPILSASVTDHLCGPILDLLKQVHVSLILRAAEVGAALQVESH